MADTKYSFGGIFNETPSGMSYLTPNGLLGNNVYARNQNIHNNLLNQGLIGGQNNQNLMSPSVSNNTSTDNYPLPEKPELKPRGFMDMLLNRNNPENVQAMEDWNREKHKTFIASLPEHEKLLYAMNPDNYILEAQKNVGKNVQGVFNGRKYAKAGDGYLYYLDGDQERVFPNVVKENGDTRELAIIEKYQRWQKVNPQYLDPNNTIPNPDYDPQLAKILWEDINKEKEQFGISVIQIPDPNAPGGIRTEFHFGDGVGTGTSSGEPTPLSLNGTDPASVTTYLDQKKYQNEFKHMDSTVTDRLMAYDEVANLWLDPDMDMKNRMTTLGGAVDRNLENLWLWIEGEDAQVDPILKAKTERLKTLVITEMNSYIKEITGAQMSENEVTRLKQAMINFGLGDDLGNLFGAGDNWIQFQAKYDVVMQEMRRVKARTNFYYRNADIIDAMSQVGITVDDMDIKSMQYDIDLMANLRNDNSGGEKTFTDQNGKEATLRYATNKSFYFNGAKAYKYLKLHKQQIMRRIFKENNFDPPEEWIGKDGQISLEKAKKHINSSQDEELSKLYLEASYQATVERNNVWGLGLEVLTMEERDAFMQLEEYQNRELTPDYGSSVNNEFLNQIGLQ